MRSSPRPGAVVLFVALCVFQAASTTAAGASDGRRLAAATPTPASKPDGEGFDDMVLTPPDIDINNLELPELIVWFAEPQNPDTAADKLLARAGQALANATNPDSNTTTTPGNDTRSANITVVGNITIPTPAGQSASWGPNWGVKSLVVELPPQVDREAGIKALQAVNNVQRVFPNYITWAVQDSPPCASQLELSRTGIQGNPSRSMPASHWGRGMSACSVNTRLRWLGRTCFKAGSKSIQYDSVVAEDLSRRGSIKTVNGQACSISRSSAAKDSAFFNRWLGSCGLTPIFNQNLPLCTTDGSPVSGPSPAPPPSPSPTPPPKDSRYTPLSLGTTVPKGVGKIGTYNAVKGGALVQPPCATCQRKAIAICDTGVDKTHPDLNYVEGQYFATPDPNCAQDDDPGVDCNGHGTHVAGIAGARGIPGGLIGVAPGADIISLKILNGARVGTTTMMMQAAVWLASNGPNKGIKAATFAMTTAINPSQDAYAFCKPFADVNNAGIVVVAAAGNDKKSMKNYIPADCVEVLAVTAADNPMTGPSVISNYLDDAGRQRKIDTTIAAPGTSINSTVPRAIYPSGYGVSSGTSMAVPHVAGVAANCGVGLTSVSCDYTETAAEKVAKIQAMSRNHSQLNPEYGFRGDPRWPIPGEYYGWLVWGGAEP